MERTYDDGMFIEAFEHGYTWLNGFMRNVRRFAERKAVIDPQTNREWNYRELNEEANKLAHALREDGAGKNDVVTAVLMNCPEFAVSYIAPRKIGAILNPANFNLSPGELALLIDHNEPKVIIFSSEVRETVMKAVSMARHSAKRLVMADNLKGCALPEGVIAYEDYISGKSGSEPRADFVPHIYDEVLRLCTSGTTALPKSVPINDINDVLSAHDVIMHYPLNCTDVTMNMTPWFHRGGCHCGGLCPTFYVGAALVVMRSFHPRQTLEEVQKYGVTYLTGAPSSLEMLARVQEKEHFDLSSLKGLVTMGAPFEKAACIRYLEVLTKNIYNGYGTTETLWNSFLRPYDLPEYAGSVGGSCIDDEVRVVKIYDDKKAEPEEMVDCDNQSEGEIIIRSPAKGTYSYYKNPEETEKKFYKGWMYTGDVGCWDKNLYVTVRGRKDDMIVCSAENIYPAQIEEVLNGFEKISDSMVTSVPDKLRGECPAAYIVPKEPVTVSEIIEYCNKSPHMAAYKRPKWFRFVETLPHTATGKKMHYVLKKQAEEDLKAGLLKRG